MRTEVYTDPEKAARFLELARGQALYNRKRPERFIEIMKVHKGGCWPANPEDGRPYRNPVIVALGDSVTAGHFEWTEFGKQMVAGMRQAAQPAAGEEQTAQTPEEQPEVDYNEIAKRMPPVEIVDARESYIEKFRGKLIDLYEQTSVSVINAGIAGDTLRGMSDRLERDVLCHQPDLVLINGALNWSEQDGTAEEYEQILRDIIARIQTNGPADIILITPNGDQPENFGRPASTLHERIAVIRKVAFEEDVCIADTYDVWETYREAGGSWDDLLANGINHPTVTGHEAYAITLMKLFE